MQPASRFAAANPAAMGLEMTGVGLWSWQPVTDVIDADPLTRDLCGLPQGKRITLTLLRTHIHAADGARLDAALQRCLLAAEGATMVEECRCPASGAERWIAFRARGLLPVVGVDRQLLGTVVDVTDRKQSESRLESEQRRFDQLLQTQRERVANTGHDLRNALAALQSAVHLIDKGSVLSASDAASLGLQPQVERITCLLNQLLSTASGDPEQAVEQSAASTAAQQSGPPAQVTQPKRILLADDNVDAANVLAMMLRLDGHEVVVAHDGQQALDLAEVVRPEILLLDVAMPVKDGLAVARAIKAQPWGAGCTLIAMSGRDRPEDRDKSAGAGFVKHLVKPLDFDEVSRLIAAVTR